VRSLVDGVPFLGEFAVEQRVQRVVILDLELTRDMSRDWFERLGLEHPERVDVVPMRGLARTLDLREPQRRAQWVRRLTGADVVILDCLNPILDALGIPVTKVSTFLNLLDEVLIEAGVPHALVVHHHNDDEQIGGGNKVRGWSDALWNTLMLDQNNPASPRFFVTQVRSRGASVGEGRLDFDPESGVLTFVAGTRTEALAAARTGARQTRRVEASAARSQAKAEDHIVMMRLLAADSASTWTASEVASVLTSSGLSERRIVSARKKCVKEGLLVESPAPGNAKVYTFTDEGLAGIGSAE